MAKVVLTLGSRYMLSVTMYYLDTSDMKTAEKCYEELFHLQPYHSCVRVLDSDYHMSCKLCDDMGYPVKEFGGYMLGCDDFYERYETIINTTEGIDAFNAYRRKKIIKKGIKVVAFVFFLICVCRCIGAIKYDLPDTLRHDIEAENANWNIDRMHYDANEACLMQVMDVNYPSCSLDKWCGELGGDTAKVRKEFLYSMKVIYSQDKFKRSASRVDFEIKHNNLYMYSIGFADDLARVQIQDDFFRFFTDCDFDTVFCYTYKGNGSKGWRVYRRGDARQNVFRDMTGYPKPEPITWWDYLTGNYHKGVEEHSKAVKEWLAKSDREDSLRRATYKAEFIAHKESLYKKRKFKY